MFNQTFDAHDLAIIGLLVILEGVLSIDNALVLGLIARRLPKFLQSKALTYGIVGAFVFRIIAIATASFLLHWRIVKLFGGAYLIYVAGKHFFFDQPAEHHDVEDSPHSHIDYAHAASTHTRAFWMAVGVIELTDIAFAIDSILAAIALVGSPPAGTPKDAWHPKLWVVVTGGMLGVVLMRFAAVIFIKLLERFPRFETSAYLLVAVIGGKLVADWGFNDQTNPHRVDFHSPSNLAFWIFWISMLICFAIGFIPRRSEAKT